jgi:hypothetical protein
MAPILDQDGVRREADMVKTFQITFTVIVFLVVAACVLLYFIHKRHGRSFWTRFNCIRNTAKDGVTTPATPQRYVPQYSSHPSVRVLQNDCPLSIYDPRTSKIINLRNLPPRPATDLEMPSVFEKPPHDYELPTTPGTLSESALTGGSGDYDVEEADVSQPGRRMVTHEARSARQPPPITQKYSLFPRPASKPNKRFDTLAHPNLLFERLDKLHPRSPSTASCLSGSTLTPKSETDGNSKDNYVPQTATSAKPEPMEIDGAKVASGWAHEQSNSMDIIRPPIALPKPIYNPKPKAPVANIHDRYDRYAVGTEFTSPRKAPLPRRSTPATEPLNTNTPPNSNFVGLMTPPTSPPSATNGTIPEPIPLDMHHAAAHGATAVAIPTEAHINRGSLRGSSVYSRDTTDMSILQDSTSAPVISDEIGTNPPFNEFSLVRTNSTDLVKDIHPSIQPTMDWPRSNVGPRSPPLHTGVKNLTPPGLRLQKNGRTRFKLMPIPENSIGRHNDDGFGDGWNAQGHDRALRGTLDMEVASPESKYYGRTAPGGAEWI